MIAAGERGTLGILGTLVWDRVGWRSDVSDPPTEPAEHWGGIAYALVAAAAALPERWEMRPIIKVGADLAADAHELLASIPRADPSALRTVPERNNRVELRYESESDRTERLTGGVPGWTWEELETECADCDALLLNFISGFELALDTAERLRLEFRGPIYADLHSLLLGVADDGTRVPRALSEWRRWCGCFDAVQVNEAEFERLDRSLDTVARAGAVLAAGPRLLVITRGGRGVTCVTRPEHGVAGRAVSRDVTLPTPRRGDPTGCGDVWGATMWSRMLAGDDVLVAARHANRRAAASLEHRGAERLIRAFAIEEEP